MTARDRIELTDEQIVAIRDEHLPSQGEPFDCIGFARAVIRASIQRVHDAALAERETKGGDSLGSDQTERRSPRMGRTAVDVAPGEEHPENNAQDQLQHPSLDSSSLNSLGPSQEGARRASSDGPPFSLTDQYVACLQAAQAKFIPEILQAPLQAAAKTLRKLRQDAHHLIRLEACDKRIAALESQLAAQKPVIDIARNLSASAIFDALREAIRAIDAGEKG